MNILTIAMTGLRSDGAYDVARPTVSTGPVETMLCHLASLKEELGTNNTTVILTTLPDDKNQEQCSVDISLRIITAYNLNLEMCRQVEKFGDVTNAPLRELAFKFMYDKLVEVVTNTDEFE